MHLFLTIDPNCNSTLKIDGDCNNSNDNINKKERGWGGKKTVGRIFHCSGAEVNENVKERGGIIFFYCSLSLSLSLSLEIIGNRAEVMTRIFD